MGSSAAGPEGLSEAMEALAESAAEIALWPGADDPRFTRSRGDGWQMALRQASLGLRAAFLIQARLRARPAGLTTRLSLAVGRVESLGSADLGDAAGPAFTASGRGLDHMAPRLRLSLSLGPATPFAGALASLAEALIQRWTREQAEALALALPPQKPTLAQIASRLSISKQAVNYRLAGAEWPAIRLALADWEDSFARHLIAGV